jgi:hypothetical protein
MINMVLTHIFFVLAKYRRKGAGVVCGCGWRKRPGGAGARRAIVALTMPRRGDVGGCGRMWVEGVHRNLKNPLNLCPCSWRIGQAGSGAGVGIVRGLAPLPLGLCATLSSAPHLCGRKGRTRARAVDCGRIGRGVPVRGSCGAFSEL